MPQEKITAVSIPVQDQQAAKVFCTKVFCMEKLGFELAVGNGWVLVQMPECEE